MTKKLETNKFFPFTSEMVFRDYFQDSSRKLFMDFALMPMVSEANTRDCYQTWILEVEHFSESIAFKDKSTPGENIENSPSHYKKAGAMICAINRMKPIIGLSSVNSVQDGTEIHPSVTDEKLTTLATLFPNEFYAVRTGFNYIIHTEKNRTGTVPFDDFLVAVDLKETGILTTEFLFDICKYLRKRSPSATSMYMMLRSYFAMSYIWRATRETNGASE